MSEGDVSKLITESVSQSNKVLLIALLPLVKSVLDHFEASLYT